MAARWRIAGRTPASPSTRRPRSKIPTCEAVEASPPSLGSSPRDRWLHAPTTSTSPSACAAARAEARAGRSASVDPALLIPVSILTWTRAGRPTARAAALMASSTHVHDTDRSMPARMAPAKSEPGVVIHASTGALARSTPARSRPSLSSTASGSWATPSQSLPEASAVRATGSRPCP